METYDVGRDEVVTGTVRLSDGRRLAYTERGDPSGVPVIHHHGMPGSRLEHEAESEFYRSLGVRVITPDRPGYGLSDALAHARLLDWPRDVLELADILGLERFGVTALSGGGIYALACAAAIPERIIEVAVTGCPAPMQRPGAMSGMRLATRVGVWLGASAPWVLGLGATAVAKVVKRYPRFVVAQANRDKPPADLRWLSMPSVMGGAAESLQEALRFGASGYVRDICALARPWGFPLDHIRVPVRLWHGDLDTVIPLRHGEYLASVIPGSVLQVCPGEAHMLLWNHLAEVLLRAAGMSPVAAGPLAPRLAYATA
ncbi:MAG TPA: alpha/beta hydrolase [Candidatus Dormibacteraeota bacterium]|nr:alpha/beta hydrolase [Candidatus Dormibacteraeota bacterium]